MDEEVIRSMARWPNVPAVHGWLRLDRRGGWYLIDRGAPGFDAARDEAGSQITSPPIIEFIQRNYASDDTGRWYWQNGPQRVYVDLDLAPLILRVLGEAGKTSLVAHTGQQVGTVDAGWVGPHGEVLLSTDLGPGVVHDLDLNTLNLSETKTGELVLIDAPGAASTLTLRPTSDPAGQLGWIARPR